MSRRVSAAVVALLLVLAVLARVHNAWVAPMLSGYDAFGHFTYIWFLVENRHVPMATHGWSFFHPPLYYALMASVWDAAGAADPAVRLKAGRTLVAALGIVHAVVAWYAVRRRFPDNRRARWMAAVLVLLVPVQLYSAGFLGNEGLNAVLCSSALLLLLLVLERPGAWRSAALGLVLGLAMLTKFSAVVIVATAAASMLAAGIRRRDLARAVRSVAVMGAVAALVCGWYYARNLAAYGALFQLSRDTFEVAYVEQNQPQGKRAWLEYVTFDPVVLRRPQWPRTGATGEEPASGAGTSIVASVRDSVWTGVYANAWFDGFGGWVLPPVYHDEAARRCGQALLTLGLVPTGLVVLGLLSALAGLVRRERDEVSVPFAFATAGMVALFVLGTREVPTSAAVKATYFLPVSAAFAYWFAHGLVRLEQLRPRWTRGVDAACAAVGALSLAVFWQGFWFDPNALGQVMPHFSEAAVNAEGVVQYAGGRTAEARRDFEQASASNYHLAWENLGFLAIDAGDPRGGLRLLRRAARAQRTQSDGGPIGRERFLALAASEYDHSIAVVLHGLGRDARAIRRWQRALRRDPSHAEARWCLALARLHDELRKSGSGTYFAPRNRYLTPISEDGLRREAFERAARELATVREEDPGLDEGWLASAAVEASRGDCDSARRTIEAWRALPGWVERKFPAPTGTGAMMSASIGRRRLIAPPGAESDAGRALAPCGLEPPRTRGS